MVTKDVRLQLRLSHADLDALKEVVMGKRKRDEGIWWGSPANYTSVIVWLIYQQRETFRKEEEAKTLADLLDEDDKNQEAKKQRAKATSSNGKRKKVSK